MALTLGFTSGGVILTTGSLATGLASCGLGCADLGATIALGLLICSGLIDLLLLTLS